MNAMLHNRPINLKRDFELYLDEEDTLSSTLEPRVGLIQNPTWDLKRLRMHYPSNRLVLKKHAGIVQTLFPTSDACLASKVRCFPLISNILHNSATPLILQVSWTRGISRVLWPKLDAYLATPYHQPEGTFNKTSKRWNLSSMNSSMKESTFCCWASHTIQSLKIG